MLGRLNAIAQWRDISYLAIQEGAEKVATN